jgi:hypothetical protein
MAESGNAKHRKSYSSGVKAVERSKWGHNTARERYGSLKFENGAPPPKDQSGPQRLGDPNNLQGPGYHNDVASDWRRGFGKNGNESAEGKPNFDSVGKKGYHGRR